MTAVQHVPDLQGAALVHQVDDGRAGRAPAACTQMAKAVS